MKEFTVLNGVNHAESILAKAAVNAERARRTPVLDQYLEPYSKIVPVPYNYDSLTKLWLHNEVTRTVGEAIIKEVARNGAQNKAKWQAKCKLCGATYQAPKTADDPCPKCGGTEYLEPDPQQKEIADAFLKSPNRDNRTDDINESLLRFMLSVDDHWVSFQATDLQSLSPPTIQVEDSVYMRVVWDERKGTVGNGEYFCPICTKDDPKLSYGKGEYCYKHPSIALKETVAVYDKGGVKARFARGEIYHGMVDPWLPGFYGNSRLIAALRIMMSVMAMDRFNLDNYTSGKLAQLLVMSGLTQADANKLVKDSFEQDQYLQEVNPLTNELVTKLRTKVLGIPNAAGSVTKVDAMPPSEKMQNIDWWRLWREAYCGLYGVTPIFVGIVEQGKTGNNPRMQIDVDNNTTEHFQHAIEAVYAWIYEKLGVTDWEYRYNPVEEKDEMQDVTILQGKLNAMVTAVSLGLTVTLTDEGEVKVSGQPLSLQEKQVLATMQAQNPQQSEKPSEDSGFQRESNFPTQKARVKSRYMVTEFNDSEEQEVKDDG